MSSFQSWPGQADSTLVRCAGKPTGALLLSPSATPGFFRALNARRGLLGTADTIDSEPSVAFKLREHHAVLCPNGCYPPSAGEVRAGSSYSAAMNDLKTIFAVRAQRSPVFASVTMLCSSVAVTQSSALVLEHCASRRVDELCYRRMILAS